LAQDEARTLGHNYIGTEHLLLGLLREEDGVAAMALRSLGVGLEEARDHIRRVVGPGGEMPTGQVPFTPRSKKVLELAKREALSLGHKAIGTEHILLGLARENQGVGARILLDLGADAESTRNQVIAVLSRPHEGQRGRALGEGIIQRPGSVAQTTLVRIACPFCGAAIETVSTDADNSVFEVTAEGERTCPGCDKHWMLSYQVKWSEAPPEASSG
jgi:ATP-dependent Clp protease ATP-binding subunit ClpA